MKFNYRQILSFLLMSSFLVSCYKLDLYPHDQVSTGTFWQTEEHAKQGVMGIYDVMKKKATSGPEVGWFGQYFMLDALTDIAICDPFASLVSGNVNNRNSEFLNKWKNMYDGIAKANHALQNIPCIEMAEEKKNEFFAEVKFLRALYYFHLLDFYGGVPIYDESWVLSESYDQMLEPRSSEDAVRDFIISDLNFAETYLPYVWDDANYGRATKAAAVALRGKVYLYAKNWELAKKDFDKLVNNNADYHCSLNPDYAEMFKPDTDENSEMIFFISNSGGTGDANDGLNFGLYHGNAGTYGGGWESSTLDPDFVDSYEKKDGSHFNWNDYIPGFNEMSPDDRLAVMSCQIDNKNIITEYPKYHKEIIAAYADRDPRLNQTCITPYSFFLGWNANKEKMMEHVFLGKVGGSANNGYIGYGGDQKWYLYRKFVPEGDCNGQITNRANVPINFPLIRYADILLMLAECYNELGDQVNAVKYINMVRARPSTNMPGLNSGPTWLEARTKEEVHERLMHERAVEFAGEGVRFSDVRRWRVAEKLCTKEKRAIHGTRRHLAKFSPRDYLWPIPGTEIEMNDKLIQNQDW